MKKIAAINGSPHGKTGNTIFCFKYSMNYFPDAEYEVFNVAARLKKVESDEAFFNSIIEGVKKADVIYWVFPAYIFIMPSQFKRFIELIWERGAQDAFKGKYATTIMTSIHFADDFPLNYIRGISEDLGMQYFAACSLHMTEIEKPEGRKKIALFTNYFSNVVEQRLSLPHLSFPIEFSPIDYNPGEIKAVEKSHDYNVLLISDAEERDKTESNRHTGRRARAETREEDAGGDG